MQRESDSWQARLPAEFLTWVIWPQYVESFHDDSVPASKWRGYDARGELCYYRHQYSQWDAVYDDEEPYARLIQSETLEAWRALDGRWLRKIVRAEGADHCTGVANDSGFEVVAAKLIPRL